MGARYSRLPDLLITVALAFLLLGCSDSRRGVNPGEIAPDIQGIDLQGRPIALHQIKGKAILVNFWATWCGPCMAELPALQSLYETLKPHGFQIVGVAVDDTVDNITEAQERFGITYPIVIDLKAQSKRGFGIRGLPESYVLNAEHKVMVIPDPGTGQPVTKLIGPRAWSQNASLQLFRSLLQ